MSEPPSEFHISPEDAPEINKASAEDEAFEFQLKKEAQAQGLLGKIWGGKDNISNNIMGLIAVVLLVVLFILIFVENPAPYLIESIVSLLTLVIGFFAGRHRSQ